MKTDLAAKAGDLSVLKAGDLSVLEAGDLSVLEAGDLSVLKAGDLSVLEAGHLSVQEAGDLSVLEAGHQSVLEAGDLSVLEKGHLSLAAPDIATTDSMTPCRPHTSPACTIAAAREQQTPTVPKPSFDTFMTNFNLTGRELSPEQQNELAKCLHSNWDIFVTEANPSLGTTHLVEHKIHLKPNAVLKHQRPYRLTPDKREVLRHQLEELLR